MKATDIKEIEAITGAKVVAATKETSSFNSDFVLLDYNGTIRQAFTVRDINGKMCVDVFAAEYDTIAAALAYLNMSDEELAQNIEYVNPNNNTPATMNANETTEFSELTHAGQCLDIYLHSTSDIYERYTVPAINAVVEAVRRNGWQLPKEEAIKNLTFWTSWQDGTKKALQAAARLVKKHDHITPTAKDIEQVTRNYAAYIVDCAKYEIEK